MHVSQNLARCRAFTLIELLTVIAIIGILAAIIIPVTGTVRKTAKSARDVSNLRQIAMANQAYAADNKGYCVVSYTPRPVDPITGLGRTWHTELRPYVSKKDTSRTGVVEIFISPCDPNGGGLVNGTPPLQADSWNRRSYSVNSYTRKYVPGGNGEYRGVILDALPVSTMIFVGNHRATEIDTHQVMPNSDASLALIPRDWHNKKDHAQFAYLDAHVKMIRVDELLSGGSLYETAWGPVP